MKVALLGDSHMQALGPLLRDGLIELGATVTRSTANQGWSVTRFIASGLVASSTAGADLAIVELGGNDQMGPEDEQAYLALLERFRASIPAPYVLWIGPATATDPATSVKHERIAAMQRKLVPKLPGTTWLDSRSYTKADHRSDGVHFDANGYARWTRHIIDGYVWLTTSPVVRATYLGSFGLFTTLRHIGG